MEQLSGILVYVSIASGYASLLISCWFFRNKTPNLLLKVLLVYLLCSIIPDSLSIFSLVSTPVLRKLHNIYNSLEYFCFLFVFYKLMQVPGKKILFVVLGAVYVLVLWYSCVYLNKWARTNNYTRSVEAMVLLVLSVWYFFQLINDQHYERLSQNYLFWLNTAILIYFSASFVIGLFSNVILSKNMSSQIHNLWMIQNIFNIFYNVFLIMAVRKWALTTT